MGAEGLSEVEDNNAGGADEVKVHNEVEVYNESIGPTATQDSKSILQEAAHKADVFSAGGTIKTEDEGEKDAPNFTLGRS